MTTCCSRTPARPAAEVRRGEAEARPAKMRAGLGDECHHTRLCNKKERPQWRPQPLGVPPHPPPPPNGYDPSCVESSSSLSSSSAPPSKFCPPLSYPLSSLLLSSSPPLLSPPLLLSSLPLSGCSCALTVQPRHRHLDPIGRQPCRIHRRVRHRRLRQHLPQPPSSCEPALIRAVLHAAW